MKYPDSFKNSVLSHVITWILNVEKLADMRCVCGPVWVLRAFMWLNIFTLHVCCGHLKVVGTSNLDRMFHRDILINIDVCLQLCCSSHTNGAVLLKTTESINVLLLGLKAQKVISAARGLSIETNKHCNYV